ncbi:pyridoxal phosphate-dependent aminotransferase [Deefgea salmonis]|uniref:Putative 8-amino-7-oxononanoate synthase n=1 Tax=Deefgea salmonis TaxID=2875502 RepID=A0ABS8BNK0_9NEIS|nr:pyridoxal phosphate-dependent aminotransferase [Deefgea salmonis]MCB5197313.1 pyridoxal phosphate-dependent aminotransferase [Deefgea salmonis]
MFIDSLLNKTDTIYSSLSAETKFSIASTEKNKLSNLANELDYSEIIQLEFYVQEQIAKGKEICDLIIGDFDTTQFPIPAFLRQEIQNAYEARHNDYPPLEGVYSLREEIAKLTRKNFNVDYDPSGEIIISGGARPLLYAALLSLVSPSELVVYPAPSWNNMYYAKMCGAKSMAIQTSLANHFLPTARDLSFSLKKARVLSLCSPQNPVGTMFSKQVLKEICDLVIYENKRRLMYSEKPLYLIYDQIYWMLTQNAEHYNPASLCPEIKDYLIVIDGGSKSFAATGIRVGWAMGPKLVINKMKLMIEHIGAIAPKAEQLAMAALLKNDKYLLDYLHLFKNKILNSMLVLHTAIQTMKQEGLPVDSMLPMAGIYISINFDLKNKVMPNGKKIKTAKDISLYFIDQAGIAIVPFTSFGTTSIEADNWFRAAICTIAPEQIAATIPRLREAILKLNIAA